MKLFLLLACFLVLVLRSSGAKKGISKKATESEIAVPKSVSMDKGIYREMQRTLTSYICDDTGNDNSEAVAFCGYKRFALKILPSVVQQAIQSPGLEIWIGVIKTLSNVYSPKLSSYLDGGKQVDEEGIGDTFERLGLIAQSDVSRGHRVSAESDGSTRHRGDGDCSRHRRDGDDHRGNNGNRGQSNADDGEPDDDPEDNHNPTEIWWDYENAPVPYDFVKTAGAGDKGELLYQRFVDKLGGVGYFGPIRIRIVVGYRDHAVPLYLVNHHRFTICVAKQIDSPVDSKDDQSADEEIKKQISEWLEEDRLPHNVIIITGDNGGFAKTFGELRNHHHMTIIIRHVDENVTRSSTAGSKAAGKALELREFLSLKGKYVSKKVRNMYYGKKKRNKVNRVANYKKNRAVRRRIAEAKAKAEMWKAEAKGKAEMWKAEAKGKAEIWKAEAKGKAEMWKAEAEDEAESWKAEEEDEAESSKAEAEDEAESWKAEDEAESWKNVTYG